MSAWTIYIVRCSDDTLYTGIARDAVKRVGEHNSSKLLAASYTRGRRPVVLVYQAWTYWVFRKRLSPSQIPDPEHGSLDLPHEVNA